MPKGTKMIVALASFNSKLRRLTFSVGKQKVILKGKKLDNPDLFPV